MDRWVEYYSELFSMESSMSSDTAFEAIESLPFMTELDETPVMEELSKVVYRLPNGKAPLQGCLQETWWQWILMSMGWRTWPSTETSRGKRKRITWQIGGQVGRKAAEDDTLGGKTVRRQPFRTRPTRAVGVKGTTIPALVCTATASVANILRLQAQIRHVTTPTDADVSLETAF